MYASDGGTPGGAVSARVCTLRRLTSWTVRERAKISGQTECATNGALRYSVSLRIK